jgi:mono/diheme cytochrome c family protein
VVFKRVVIVVELLALVAVAVFVVMLFANEPSTSGGGSAASTPGAHLFAANCATCHGSDGGGGVGPQLSDGKAVAAFPTVDDEVQFVTTGRDGMPAFGGQLSAAEIADVVDYTRTL